MIRGIDLGTLLICFSLALHFCCSWASQEESTWPRKLFVPFWNSQNSVKDSRPQDGFRQANEVKGSSSYTGAKSYPSDKYLISQTNPGWQGFYGSIGRVLPKKVASEGYEGISSNQYNGVFRTLPGQQGTQRISQYAPSKSDLNSPKQSSHQPSAWKRHEGEVKQNPGLNTKFNGKRGFKALKEFTKPTEGLARGRKRIYQKGVSKKHSFSNSQTNPVRSSIYHRYELPISKHLGLSQSHAESAHNLGEVSFVVHHIPWEYGGHPIKRSGDEEPVVQKVPSKRPQKPLTKKPPKMYTVPPLQKEAYTLPPWRTEAYNTPKPKHHKKSKWIQVLSYKLAGVHGVPVRTL